MGKLALSKLEIRKIKELRETGHSLNEIKNIINRGYGTIFRYIKDVEVLPNYQESWRIKRGGSKKRSENEWVNSREKALSLIGNLGIKERMIILSCLYWGEGNKTELNVINSDPHLIRTVLVCLKDFGIEDSELKVSLRLFKEINQKEAITFWSKVLNLPDGFINKIDVVEGNKPGKLKYGMCRIRVKKSGKYFKLIMSMIDLIKSNVK